MAKLILIGAAVCIVLVIVLVWSRAKKKVAEGYKPCAVCDLTLPKGGINILNPFIWPWSATRCLGDVYFRVGFPRRPHEYQRVESELPANKSVMYQQSVPDHIPETN